MDMPNLSAVHSLPTHGFSHDLLLSALEDLRKGDADWHSGKTWCLVYHANDAHSAFLKQAHNAFFSENGLNPFAFKSLRQMESQAVRMVANLLNAPEHAVGSLTSGGTESILLAVKTYRDRARRKKPWIRKPEMVVPRTIHVAFEKAAQMFGVKLRFAPSTDDFRADVRAMRGLINRNTIAIAASAPHYPQGVIDPIEEIGKLAAAKKLPFHVDACVGGLMLPFVERLGRSVPLWDFRVPGVTSVSADLHKYGYAAKGASTLVYRSADYFRDQIFVSTDWPGGIYASATLPGTRPGGPIAAAWATLLALGEDGYLDLTRRALAVVDTLRAAFAAVPSLEILGEPAGTMLTFTTAQTSGLNVFALADALEAKGWHFDRHQNPDAIHLTVSAHNEQSVDAFIADVRASVENLLKNPELNRSESAAMYGMMAKVPARGFIKKTVRDIFTKMYAHDGAIDFAELTSSSNDPVMAWAEKMWPRMESVIDGAQAAKATLKRSMRFRRRR